MGVNDRNNLQREGWDARRAVLSHSGSDRLNQEVSGSRKINARCSQPSGDVEGGCVSNFLKRAFIKG
jgi:hypothetical protein